MATGIVLALTIGVAFTACASCVDAAPSGWKTLVSATTSSPAALLIVPGRLPLPPMTKAHPDGRPIPRRAVLLLLPGLGWMAFGCKRAADRCEFCGMKIDPTSAWTAELTGNDGATHRFDTSKCALLAWKTGRVPARSSRFQEFYERAWHDGTQLTFATGSDVVGPMGGDAVPVAPDRGAKFASDHHARLLAIDELTVELLQSL